MGSSISTIADLSPDKELLLERHKRLEAGRRRKRAERWYSNMVSEEQGLQVQYLHVLAPIEDEELQPNQDSRNRTCTSGCNSISEKTCEGKRHGL